MLDFWKNPSAGETQRRSQMKNSGTIRSGNTRDARTAEEWRNMIAGKTQDLTRYFEKQMNRNLALKWWPYMRVGELLSIPTAKVMSEAYVIDDSAVLSRPMQAFLKSSRASFDQGLTSAYDWWREATCELVYESNFLAFVEIYSLMERYPMYIEQIVVNDTVAKKDKMGWMFETGGRSYAETEMLFVRYTHDRSRTHIKPYRDQSVRNIWATPTYQTMANTIAQGLAIQEILNFFFDRYQHIPYIESELELDLSESGDDTADELTQIYLALKLFRDKRVEPYLDKGQKMVMPTDLEYLMELFGAEEKCRMALASFFGLDPQLLGFYPQGTPREVIERHIINFMYGAEPVIDSFLSAINLRFALTEREKLDVPRFKYMIAHDKISELITSLDAQPGQREGVIGADGIRRMLGIPSEWKDPNPMPMATTTGET